MEQIPQEMPPQTHPAFARLEEFPSDPIAAAEAIAKRQRQDEMLGWAEGIGAHTERMAARHHRRSIEVMALPKDGKFDRSRAETELRQVPENRTGVVVDEQGNIMVHDAYPYSGDTPAKGWKSFRSPRNIKK